MSLPPVESIDVPVDLGELGGFTADVGFTREEAEDGLHITIIDMIVQGHNILDIARPDRLIRDTIDYINSTLSAE